MVSFLGFGFCGSSWGILISVMPFGIGTALGRPSGARGAGPGCPFGQMSSAIGLRNGSTSRPYRIPYPLVRADLVERVDQGREPGVEGKQFVPRNEVRSLLAARH